MSRPLSPSAALCPAVLALAGSLGLTASAHAQAEFPVAFVGHYYPGLPNNNPPVPNTIATFRLAADGSITLIHNTTTPGWTQAMDLSPSGRYLAAAVGTASTTTEVCTIYEVNPDGSLTELFQDLVPDSPLDLTWIDDDHLAVLQTSSGGTNSIGVYRIDRVDNRLRLQEREIGGGFITEVFFDDQTRTLYTNANNQLSLYGYTLAPNYTLSPQFVVSTGMYGFGLSRTPDGRFLYGGAGTGPGSALQNAFFGYRVEADGGLTPLPFPFYSQTNGVHRTTVTGNGQFLVIGHSRRGDLRSFSLDESGVPTDTNGLFVVQPAQASIGSLASFRDNFILVTDQNSAFDGVTGLMSLRVESDGTFTQIGELVYTGTPRPGETGGMLLVWDPGDATACPGDFDGDGEVTTADITAFLSAWFSARAGEPDTGADFDNDGQVTTADITAFLSAWFAARAGACD